MKNKTNLARQLLAITVIVISIIMISLGVILPRNLLPIYEENIYFYLKQPLEFIESDLKDYGIDSEIVYLYITGDNKIVASDNIIDIVSLEELPKVLGLITGEYGRFTYKAKTYYYNTSKVNMNTKIAITDDSYIRLMRISIFRTIVYTVGIAYIIATALLLLWSNNLVSKIKRLKDKVANIDNDNYNHSINLKVDDELYSLAVALERMRLYLKQQEEYKNQMYQNISHDFKTPITVMKSYIEAYEDGIETEEKSLAVLKEQINKLELKVHSLLYLNKINYIKDKKDNLSELCDVGSIINTSIQKFKVIRSDVNFVLDLGKKNTLFRGTVDMWEAIIDNILANFVRYAEKEIKISIKNNRIILFNDGPNIDEKILTNIFTPYEKGVNGIFGLGLSIVQKTLQLLEYDIVIENEKKGVRFTIK